ncbi:alpha/beta hydrolase family protein [Halosegnis marinus]|uniref:Prolyl oligopeptidase family serine peptidase n=1 Tax=Halosegnis marinus TaxID=3034023 RepID=A0ABD5ZM61_9EURY|nr:S9 family peptidase [Halosegnis sp. DT85]
MPEPLDLADLVELPDVYNPVLDPAGERVAFYYDETGRVELYVQELGDERERLSEGNVPRNARYPLAWSRDGERIYFHEDEGGDEQNDIHAMTLDGEREPVVVDDGQAVLEDVAPDGSLLFTTTAEGQKNLFRYEDGERTRLTDYDRPVWGAISGPDGRVAYVTNEAEDRTNRDVYVCERDGSDARKLDVGETGGEAHPADWTGDRLLVDDNSAGLGRAGVYDLGSGETTWYGPGEAEEQAVRLTDDGVLALRNRECAVVPVRYDDPDGAGTEFALPEGVASPAGHGTSRVTTADGRLLVAFGTDTDRRAVVAYDAATGDSEAVVAAEYGDVDPDRLADAEYVTFESHDGTEIDGLLYDSGERPSPGIVSVHGGPHAQTLRRFAPFTQYLVSQGYSVFAPNYRGSTGRGREFKNAIHGDWGGAEQGDVAEAGRWLADRDWVDADRVAVTGGSYGGYSAYWQLTNYDLWAAGVAIVGITDLPALYEESMPHFKSVLEQQLGDPEANADLYRERSPITHADGVADPLCMVHGVNDPRCPVSQARRFRDALAERGLREGEDGDFEYHELGEEGHGSTDTDQRLRQYRILADFLDRRL